jgi:hypothetical protein
MGKINENSVKDATRFEEADPNPEYLIKSISEQGYSLETSLADLMDNSVSANANKIEILVQTNLEPFVLFVADNGDGMDESSLKKNMHFPSTSSELSRATKDLGRFGLGMKTASFAQTRCFTVISRKKDSTKYNARTWDVNYLKNGGWKIIINNENEIGGLLEQYQELSSSYLSPFEDFFPNTIIVWQGLYKFDYLDEKDRVSALQREINEITSEHLSVVFHRFLEKPVNPLQIRVNNIKVPAFNPFPTKYGDFRSIEYKLKDFHKDSIKIEGFVLPSRSIDETKQGTSYWTTRNRSLTDMEGIYIYRSDRLIRFGDWSGIIKKSPRMQLARLKVEVGNNVDHLLHLNVAKSQITIPHDLKKAFLRYISILKDEAEKEYYNRGLRCVSGNKKKEKVNLFVREATNKGIILKVNDEFPLLAQVFDKLDNVHQLKLKAVLQMINSSVNKIRHVHEEKHYGSSNDNTFSIVELGAIVDSLILGGVSSEQIRENIIPGLGYSYSSIPEEIKNKIK